MRWNIGKNMLLTPECGIITGREITGKGTFVDIVTGTKPHIE
jgi:hypothetical protein